MIARSMEETSLNNDVLYIEEKGVILVKNGYVVNTKENAYLCKRFCQNTKPSDKHTHMW